MSEGAKVPRIALLLSGLPRLWREALPSQLALLQPYPHDIFFHFWDTVDVADKKEITLLLKPRACRFEAPKDFSNYDTSPSITHDLINIPSRMMSQYTSWRGVAELFEPDKNDYDLVIRSRADLQFVYRIDHILPHLKSNEILMPWWDQSQRLLCDLFAVGGVEPILHYHKLIDHVFDYNKTRQFNPELMLTAHFEARPNFKIYGETRQYFFIRRPHMTNYTIEQAMLENPGRNKWLDPEVYQAHLDHYQKKQGESGAAYVKDFRHTQLRTLVNEVQQKVAGDKDKDVEHKA